MLRGPTGNFKASTDAQVGHVMDGFVQTCIRTASNPAVLPSLLRRTALYKLSLLTHNNPRLREEPEAKQEPGQVAGQGSNSAASSPLLSSRRLKLKGSVVSNFPLAQHRVAVSASAGLSLCTAHGATEQGKPLPARPRGRISPGETENTKLAGFYSWRLGSARYSEFLVH